MEKRDLTKKLGIFFYFTCVVSVLKMNVLRSLFCSFSLVLLLRGKNIDYLHFSMSKIVVEFCSSSLYF